MTGYQPWTLSWRADPKAREIADRHYSRQSHGHAQFVPPGRCLVLKTRSSLWVTSWPQYVSHAWPGAWVCTLFRNEGPFLSSDLITKAVAATRWRWDTPAEGMVTFVDPSKVRRKRDPGRCFLRAGFQPAGHTQGGLVALHLAPDDMPPALAPEGAQLRFEEYAIWSG